MVSIGTCAVFATVRLLAGRATTMAKTTKTA